MGYVPKKRASWTDRLEYSGQVEELMSLIQWSRLDGPAVVGSFLSRRVQPCERRVHSGYEHQGSQDMTRMKESLEKTEVHHWISELFNLADSGFVQSNDRMHAYKLARPPPKVTRRILRFASYSLLSLTT